MSMASDIINGEICGECNLPFESENGYPALCESCWKHKHPTWSFDEMKMDEEGFQPSACDIDRGDYKR